MASTLTAGVKDLKNRLSSYLRHVKAGERILVTERGVVVAELRRPGPDAQQPLRSSMYDEWVAQGRLVPPKRPRSPLDPPAVKMEEGFSQRLIDLDRGE